MGMLHIEIDPTKAPGQTLYERAAASYDGPNPWDKWETLDDEDRAGWAEMEREI